MAPAANLTVRISAQIADLQKEMKQASSTVDRFVGDFDKSVTKAAIVGNVFGNMITALPGIVGSAVRSFVDFSGRMSDLSSRTGIGTRELQRFAVAGELVDVSLEQITQAVAQRQNRLASGDKGALTAIKDLGLTFDAIKQLDPGAQFEAIATRIAAIQDPAERTRIAMDVFGRSGSAIMALLRTDIKKVGDEYERLGGVIKDETIKAGDQLGDLFTKLKGLGIRLTAEALQPLLTTIRQMNDPAELTRWEQFKAGLDATPQIQKLKELAGALREVAAASRGDVGLPKVAARPTAAGSTPTVALPSSAELDRISNSLTKQVEASIKAAEAQQKYLESVRELRDELSGAKLQREVTKLQAAFKGLIAQGPLTSAQFDRVGLAAKRLFDEGATLTPELFRILLASQRLTPAVETVGDEFFEAGKKIRIFHDESVPLIGVINGIKTGMEDVIPVEFPPAIAKAIEDTQRFRDGLTQLRQALDFLTGGSSGVFGQIVGEMADVVAAFEAGVVASVQYTAALTKLQKAAAFIGAAGAIAQGTASGSTGGRVLGGAAAGASFGSTFGPYGAAIGAAAGALVGLFRGMAAAGAEAKKLNDQLRLMKNSLVDAHGSMARLETMANMVGLSFEAAWNVRGQAGLELISRLTDELTEKQNKLNAAMEEYGFTWEDTGDKFRQLALSDMADALLKKTQLLQGAGIDYNAILEKQATQYSELVQAAIRTGTEIPAALRPVIEKLIEMGLLTNAAGAAITDITEVPFAETLTRNVDRIVDKLDELIRKLTEGVGGAIDDLGRRRIDIPVDFHYNTPNRVEVDQGGGDSFKTEIFLDGDKIAESTARRLPGVLEAVI